MSKKSKFFEDKDKVRRMVENYSGFHGCSMAIHHCWKNGQWYVVVPEIGAFIVDETLEGIISLCSEVK